MDHIELLLKHAMYSCVICDKVCSPINRLSTLFPISSYKSGHSNNMVVTLIRYEEDVKVDTDFNIIFSVRFSLSTRFCAYCCIHINRDLS